MKSKVRQETKEALLQALDEKIIATKERDDIYQALSIAVPENKISFWGELGKFEHLEEDIISIERPDKIQEGVLIALNNYLIGKSEVVAVLSAICKFCIQSKDILAITKSMMAELEVLYPEHSPYRSTYDECYRQSTLAALNAAVTHDFLTILNLIAVSEGEEMEAVQIGNLQLKHSLPFNMLSGEKVIKSALVKVFEANSEKNLALTIIDGIRDAYKINPKACINFAKNNQAIFDTVLNNSLLMQDKLEFRDIISFIIDNKQLAIFFKDSYVNGLHEIYKQVITRLQLEKKIDIHSSFDNDPLWQIVCSKPVEFEEYLKQHSDSEKTLILLMRLIVRNDCTSYSLPLIKTGLVKDFYKKDESLASKMKKMAFTIDTKSNLLEFEEDDWGIVTHVSNSPAKSKKTSLSEGVKNFTTKNLKKEYEEIIKLFSIKLSDKQVIVKAHKDLMKDSADFEQDFKVIFAKSLVSSHISISGITAFYDAKEVSVAGQLQESDSV